MLTYRKAGIDDLQLYFEWANDETVRKNSINKSPIAFEDHCRWFKKRLEDAGTAFLLFYEGPDPVGQLRIDVQHDATEAIINYSIAQEHRGKGYGVSMLSDSFSYFSRLNLSFPLTGLVNENNIASIKAFEKAGYQRQEEMITINGEQYVKFSRQ